MFFCAQRLIDCFSDSEVVTIFPENTQFVDRMADYIDKHIMSSQIKVGGLRVKQDITVLIVDLDHQGHKGFKALIKHAVNTVGLAERYQVESCYLR